MSTADSMIESDLDLNVTAAREQLDCHVRDTLTRVVMSKALMIWLSLVFLTTNGCVAGP